MGTGRVYIETMGCQMNVLDSELVLGQLRSLGYEPTDRAGDAQVVLLNTCSVREHAEDKVYSRLGELEQLKKKHPEVIVGVIGCMAERDDEGLKRRTGLVDLLCGPGRLNEIPGLLEEVLAHRAASHEPAVSISLEHDHSRKVPKAQRTLLYDSIEALDLSRQAGPGESPLQAYIRVQRGCDKFCTYCVVPFTRGPERCRAPEHILEEARRLADGGTREITLLGQTVNSYAYEQGGRVVRFAELLDRLNGVAGLERIRFVTSYPGDFTVDILEAMCDLPKVCEYLHLPAQSGSNTVLQRMRRQYTVEQYLELIARARETVPGLTLAGDFIVGFSGETQAEHEESLRFIEQVGYKSIYMFKYSQRPGTSAERHQPDDVPTAVKKQRHLDLIRVQTPISLAHHRGLIGRTVEVLVEGPSKAALKARQAEQGQGPAIPWRVTDQLTGRTRGDEIAVFRGPDSLAGQLVRVTVNGATPYTLHAEVASPAGSLARLAVV